MNRRLKVVVGCALVVAACSDSGSGSAVADDDAVSQLHSPAATVASAEVWVIGGAAGPEGSSPPVSSDVPEGWGPNRTVTRYTADGEQIGRYRLPADLGSLLDPTVVADGDRRFLIATSCGQPMGCGAGNIEPVRFELIDDDFVRRPLDLPPLEASPTTGNGMLRPIGLTGSVLWALQQVPPDHPDALSWTSYRLLEIDAVAGGAVEFPLPSGPAEPRWLCVLNGGLVFAQPTIVDGLPSNVTIFHHNREEGAAWRELTEVTPSDVGGLSAIGCLPGAQEIALVRASLEEAEVLTFSASTGEAVAPVTPMHASYLERFFELGDGEAIGIGRDVLGQPLIYARDPAGWTERSVEGLRSDSLVLLVAGSLYDVSALLNSTSGGRIGSVEILDG